MSRLAFLLAACCFLSSPAVAAEKALVAAAADLKFALDEIVSVFRQRHPNLAIEPVYGSSGKFHTQIQQGAPYDLFFSADIQYPRMLAEQGIAGSNVVAYARGRLVIWSATHDVRAITIADLANPSMRRIAIANPRHAPYGKRAEEALRAAGVWERVEARLIFGENIAQTAQYVQSGNADVGLIALALAVNPELKARGGYALVPEHLHQPLEQGYVLTRKGAQNHAARAFADFIGTPDARRVMVKYGFVLPDDTTAR